MTFKIYQPVPVLLPESTGLRREFLNPGPGMGDEEYAQYDSRTMFYDVFRREEDPCRVVAIGPPPVNLARELRGLSISRAGRPLRRRLRLYPRFTVVEIMLDRGAAMESELELDFAFPPFTARVRVPPPAEGVSAPPRPEGGGEGPRAAEPLAMMTLQKDNEIAWIEDWCRWHRRLHDVTRLRIYDNGSANIGLLEEALRRLGEEMDILLVRWPYPFGPFGKLFNRLTQQGAMNHYRVRFGARDAWCLLMDVDEYLVASGERSLRGILAASERRGIVSLHLGSFVVPTHPGQATTPDRRIWHYTWRKRRQGERKSICIPSRVLCSNIHYAYPGNRFIERCARWRRVGYRLLHFWYRRVPGRIECLERRSSPWFRAGAWLLRRVLPGTRRVRVHPREDLFFFHFRGLNTNWKPGLGEKVESFDPERHVEDPRIRALAEQAGLVPDRAAPPGAGTPKGEDAHVSDAAG